jgi:hypothetical protein
MARTRGLGSRKDVAELRPPDPGNALAGLSLMTQSLEQLHRRSRGTRFRGGRMRTDTS